MCNLSCDFRVYRKYMIIHTSEYAERISMALSCHKQVIVEDEENDKYENAWDVSIKSPRGMCKLPVGTIG